MISIQNFNEAFRYHLQGPVFREDAVKPRKVCSQLCWNISILQDIDQLHMTCKGVYTCLTQFKECKINLWHHLGKSVLEISTIENKTQFVLQYLKRRRSAVLIQGTQDRVEEILQGTKCTIMPVADKIPCDSNMRNVVNPARAIHLAAKSCQPCLVVIKKDLFHLVSTPNPTNLQAGSWYLGWGHVQDLMHRIANDSSPIAIILFTDRAWALPKTILRSFPTILRAATFATQIQRNQSLDIVRQLFERLHLEEDIPSQLVETFFKRCAMLKQENIESIIALVSSRLIARLRHATHFRQVHGKWKACNRQDKGAICRKFQSVPPTRIFYGPISLRDLTQALSKVESNHHNG